jgi:hypothetical protein
MTETSSAAGLPRPAWNKGKITGPKPPQQQTRPVTHCVSLMNGAVCQLRKQSK